MAEVRADDGRRSKITDGTHGEPRGLVPGDPVRDKWDGERGVFHVAYDWPGSGWGEVVFERHGRCRIPLRRLIREEDYRD